MNLEQILRLGLTAAVWVVVAILMSIFGFINIIWGVPAIISWLIIGAGGAGTALLWNQASWEQLRQSKLLEVEARITQEIQKMNKKDMVEMADGLRQLKEKYGIELDLPLADVQKNDWDALLSRLSQEELVDVQQRLRSGDLSEEDLANWLQTSNKVLRG